ncbi:hypothetical protein ACFQ0K_12270 [Nocardioides caeni]|uniref:Chemotaxis methyl-accepting receptor HlyB-like 4HB MCP domain-containing protein n=1 Tax=Nocardioides caeni TaxID=574700 RepID=A0A4S8NLP1_9ACTN|nr:hypothetical protein [Nocardioides caeni]THV17788.1 hypothetical protein E9934_04800 [Nocardioides caeni]
MTQAAPTPAPAPPVVQPATTPAAARQPAPSYVDTPALLNRWQLIGMSVAIVFAVLSALVQLVGWQSDGRAADDTEQLLRVQEIQSTLLRADALATNAFLVGGLEDTDDRAEYDAAIDSVLRQIAAAADAQPADQDVLADLNVAINDYDSAVARARDFNRLGYPVGAEYLTGASTALRADAIPILEALVAANTDRAEGAMNGQHPFWLLAIGLLALAGLLWLNQQLAQHFRRRINKGIAIAAAIVVGVTVVAVIGAWARDSSNDGLRDGSLAVAVSQATARTAANDAKANESLRLIKRGSGADYETAWSEAAAVAEDALRRDTGDAWDAYADAHADIVELDDGGDWEQARDLATTDDADGSTDDLDAFDGQSQAIVDTESAKVTDDLRSGRWLALTVSVLTLLLGIVAAVAVARGVGERRREFA